MRGSRGGIAALLRARFVRFAGLGRGRKSPVLGSRGGVELERVRARLLLLWVAMIRRRYHAPLRGAGGHGSRSSPYVTTSTGCSRTMP